MLLNVLQCIAPLRQRIIWPKIIVLRETWSRGFKEGLCSGGRQLRLLLKGRVKVIQVKCFSKGTCMHIKPGAIQYGQKLETKVIGNWIYDSAWFYPSGSHRVSSALLPWKGPSSVWTQLCWPRWLSLLKPFSVFPTGSFVLLPKPVTFHLPSRLIQGHADTPPDVRWWTWRHVSPSPLLEVQARAQCCLPAGVSLGGRKQTCGHIKFVMVVQIELWTLTIIDLEYSQPWPKKLG